MYTKLSNTILTSTVWMEPHETRIVWIAMLAMADKNGEVQASVPGLANVARVSVEDCRKALDVFMQPDPNSRTETDEGRRIEKIPGGWAILNHSKYRELDSDEDRKRKNAERQRRYRERHKRNVSDVTCYQELPQNSQAEADTDTDTDPFSTPLPPKGGKAQRGSEEDPIKEDLKQLVVNAYNRAAKARGWFGQPKVPKKGTTADLLTKRISEPDFIQMLDRYVELVSQLDWAEAKRFDFFLRRQTFDKVISGEWGPRAESTKQEGTETNTTKRKTWADEQFERSLREMDEDFDNKLAARGIKL